MRKYAYLKNPQKCNDKEYIYKIMLHTQKEGVYLYEYCSLDAIFCSYDQLYFDVNDIYGDWNSEIDERGWIDIDDPLSNCQHDAFLPIRIKGREQGNPEWGKYEILENGEWIEYKI